MSSRVEATLDACRSEGRAALIGYLPVGFPTLQESIDAAVALVENGADIVELGLPYSDPVMDGLVIQEATQTALANGFRLSDAFTALRAITERVSAPILVMTYWNPVVQYGVERFAADLADAGGAGLITPDLIPDEAAEWLEASEKHDLDRIFLAAPSSTPERLANTVAVSRGFVYAVSTMGITGERADVDAAAHSLVDRLREAGATHVGVGVGISSAAQVTEVQEYAEGAIVGSVLVKALSEGGVSALAELASTLSGHVERESVTSA
jgi:tryptophan synthase alpha chain